MRAFFTGDAACAAPAQALASASHFFMKLDLAAPASGLPFLSIAFDAQAGAAAALLSFSHFFMKLDLAAPASGLPFLSMALASQVAPAAGAAILSCAWAPKERQAPSASRERSFFMAYSSLKGWKEVTAAPGRGQSC